MHKAREQADAEDQLQPSNRPERNSAGRRAFARRRGKRCVGSTPAEPPGHSTTTMVAISNSMGDGMTAKDSPRLKRSVVGDAGL